MVSYKMRKMNGESWIPPSDRKMVCKHCLAFLNDSESFLTRGEFLHPERDDCNNSQKIFYLNSSGDDVSSEAAKAGIQMFVRKKWRKYQK